jgi:transmembrane sensor
MINYSNYKTDDYLSDESFRQWVLNGGFRNKESHWSLWLTQHPEHQSEALIAREIILAIHINEEPFADDYFETIRRDTVNAVGHKRNMLGQSWVWRAAAAAVLISGLLGWYGWKSDKTEVASTEISGSRSIEHTEFVRSNETKSLVPVALPDGSSVLLHPNSNLKYRKLPGGTREVFLVGKAFFEVTKDPAHPFLVYSGEMVTRVLGTSFTVTAYEKDADFSVVVKTGKVAVFRLSESADELKNSDFRAAVNLIPNEQVVFNREKLLFKRKGLLATDMLEFVPATRSSYAFEDAPVADIFRQIGKAYGLKIDMDASLFKGCELTTNLSDEPLFEKLNIVCNSVGPGTSYIIEDGHIRVISGGCNQ